MKVEEMRSATEAGRPDKRKAAGRTPSGSSNSRPTTDLNRNLRRSNTAGSSVDGGGCDKKDARPFLGKNKTAWLLQVQADPATPAAAFSVAFSLAFHWNDRTRVCRPSQDLIAAETCMSPRQVRNHIRALEAAGHITVHTGRGAGHASRYDLHILPSEKRKDISALLSDHAVEKAEISGQESGNFRSKKRKDISAEQVRTGSEQGEALRLPPIDISKETKLDARETIERALEARSISHEPEYPDAPEWLGDGDWEPDFEPADMQDDDRQPFRWADLDDELDASHSNASGTATLPPIAAAFASKLPPQLRDRLRVGQGLLAIPGLEDPEAVWLAMGGPAFVERQMREGLNPTEAQAADDIERIRDLVGAAVYLLGPDHPRADAFDRISVLIGRPIERTDPRHPLSLDFLPF